MVEGKIVPHERFESGAGRRRGNASQSDVLEQLLAPGLAFFVELFRGRFKGLEDGRVRCRLRILLWRSTTWPAPELRLRSPRGLPVADDGRDARQVVMKLSEVVQCVTEADEAGTYRS